MGVPSRAQRTEALGPVQLSKGWPGLFVERFVPAPFRFLNPWPSGEGSRRLAPPASGASSSCGFRYWLRAGASLMVASWALGLPNGLPPASEGDDPGGTPWRWARTRAPAGLRHPEAGRLSVRVQLAEDRRRVSSASGASTRASRPVQGRRSAHPRLLGGPQRQDRPPGPFVVVVPAEQVESGVRGLCEFRSLWRLLTPS